MYLVAKEETVTAPLPHEARRNSHVALLCEEGVVGALTLAMSDRRDGAAAFKTPVWQQMPHPTLLRCRLERGGGGQRP